MPTKSRVESLHIRALFVEYSQFSRRLDSQLQGKAVLRRGKPSRFGLFMTCCSHVLFPSHLGFLLGSSWFENFNETEIVVLSTWFLVWVSEGLVLLALLVYFAKTKS